MELSHYLYVYLVNILTLFCIIQAYVCSALSPPVSPSQQSCEVDWTEKESDWPKITQITLW